MSRKLNYCFIRKLTTFIRPKVIINLPSVHPNIYFFKGSKIFLVSQICSTIIRNETPKVDLEDDLQKAFKEGDVAIIKLMNQLKEFVIIVSKEYRNCLIKQIEITKAAANAGPLSELWDELPEHRVLADELNKELNDYMTLFNTIGQMSFDNLLMEFVTGSNDNLDDIDATYKELKVSILNEFEENRRLEKQLVEIKRDGILKNALEN